MSLEYFSMPGNIEYSKNVRETVQVIERKHGYLHFYLLIFLPRAIQITKT